MNGVLDYPVWTHFSHFEFWILPNFDLWSQENVGRSPLFKATETRPGVQQCQAQGHIFCP